MTKARTGLRSIRNIYGADIERRKREFIAALTTQPPRSMQALVKLHEDLLFLRAFPGDAQTLRLALHALEQMELWFSKAPRADRATLDDSGAVGSTSRYVFPFPIVQWLVRRAAGEVEIDWRNYDNSTRLDLPLRAFARVAERDGFDSGEYSTREWVAIARRRDVHTDVQWIIEALNTASGFDADQLWTAAEPPIVWDLKGSRWSVTHNALPAKPYVMRRAMRRPARDPVSDIAKPHKHIRLLEPRQARKVIDVTRAALTARCREVVSISYANPNEVHWCDLGQGAALAVIGAVPHYRMSIEANYGYLLLSNGVPIGYGGVTALFRQANTGINIFEPFRGSEAAFLWTAMLRAFHTLFGVRRFIVNGYQFGEGNAEAIRSGAYWFYYRLGFRPVSPTLNKQAAREASRLAKPGAQRSSVATLKALAQGDLVLDLPGFSEEDHFDETLLPQLGARAAGMLAAEPLASRAAAEQRLADRLAATLGVRSMKNWPRAERRAFAMLAAAVSIVPDFANWNRAERQSLIAMMRAKGHAQESDFARAATKTPHLFRALAQELKSGSP
ncbi:MAG: hypothetical protein GXP06_10220 [Alphaproteobacteria bacterium]|nr:hypothetical protein [Alphaproteobacteria bacterium]